MSRSPRVAVLVCTGLLLSGCQKPADAPPRTRDPAADFGRTVQGLLLDTTLFEIRGVLIQKVVNPDRQDESPLADSVVANVAPPGPHLHDGVMHADVGALTALLGRARPMTIEEDRVFVGTPPVLIIGHRHGDALFVPVKLFARQYGAYVDVGCTPANCATIWTADILRHMRAIGAIGGSGILGAHAEGLLDSIDVRKLPTG
jgi:hypothetical protein